MAANATFRRYEFKYRLNTQQYLRMKEVMKDTMIMDEYGRNHINNIYFDTPDYLLIRRSLEKPTYKEKLRVRWYGPRDEKTPIYIELKKKYKGIVYKRRIKSNWQDTKGYFFKHEALPTVKEQQIRNELDYFLKFYGNLAPMLFLGYEREAFYGVENKDFRLTFDFNIRCTQGDIIKQKDIKGVPILEDDQVLLEVKTAEGLPAWLLDFFGKEEIYRSSFSKYGTAYQNILLPEQREGEFHSA